MLNHGSFGACPRVVLQRQHELRCQMEARPVQFLVRQMPELLDASRQRLAETDRRRSAGPGLCSQRHGRREQRAAIAALPWRRRDPRDHARLQRLQQRGAVRGPAEPATLVVAEIPSPVESPQQIVDAVMSRVSPRTRIAAPGSYQQPVGRCLSHRAVGRAAAAGRGSRP